MLWAGNRGFARERPWYPTAVQVLFCAPIVGHVYKATVLDWRRQVMAAAVISCRVPRELSIQGSPRGWGSGIKGRLPTIIIFGTANPGGRGCTSLPRKTVVHKLDFHVLYLTFRLKLDSLGSVDSTMPEGQPNTSAAEASGTEQVHNNFKCEDGHTHRNIMKTSLYAANPEATAFRQPSSSWRPFFVYTETSTINFDKARSMSFILLVSL